jgi:hypothetical protein
MSDKVPPSPETPEEARGLEPSSVNVQTVAFTLICIAIVILLLQFMQPVLLPLVLAGLLFYALDRPVDWLQKQRVPRAIGAAAMMLIVISSCGALAYSLQGQALTVIDQLPTGARRLAAVLRKQPGGEPGAVEKMQQAADALQEAEKRATRPGVTRVQIEEKFEASTFVWSTSVGLASAANQVVMVLFLTYFMLLSDELFKRKLVEIVGTLSQKKATVNVLEDIAGQIEQFLLLQILTSGAVAVVTGAALDGRGCRSVAPHHDARRVRADADAREPRLIDESGGGLCGAAVLELGVGDLGHAARGADDDGDQSHLRSRRALAAGRTSARRVTRACASAFSLNVPSRHAAHGLVWIPVTIAVGGRPRATPSTQSPETRSASSGTIRTRTGPTSGSP